MRGTWTLIAAIIFSAFAACVSQAHAETLMCPPTITLGPSPPVEGWTVGDLREGQLSAAQVNGRELRCVYNNAGGFTLTRTVPAQVSCAVISGGFECTLAYGLARGRGGLIGGNRPPIDTSPVTTTPCDLAVSSITLTKLATPGVVRVSYEITNRSRSAWNFGSNRATATLVVTAYSGLRRLSPETQSRQLPPTAAAGASMMTASVDLRDNFFDFLPYPTEFSGGVVDVTIAFAGTANADRSVCSVDLVASNNAAQVPFEAVAAFMGGTQTTQTWTF